MSTSVMKAMDRAVFVNAVAIPERKRLKVSGLVWSIVFAFGREEGVSLGWAIMEGWGRGSVCS